MSEVNQYIDPHDAIIDDIRIHPSGDVDIAFAHLNAFEQVGYERYDVWSYRAALLCRQVTALEMTGIGSGDAWVSDMSFDGVPEYAPTNRAGLPIPVNGFELILDNGAIVRVVCASVCWRLGSRIKRLETWEGPLQS